MSTLTTHATSVLIVGAGPAGLTAAALLAAQGTQVILLEERGENSPHPRAIGFTATTMETFRKLGIEEDAIPCAPANFRLVRRTVESLAGKQSDDSLWSNKKPEGKSGIGSKVAESCSYVRGSATPQDKVERVLMDRAVALGADIRMAHRVVRVEQSPDGVAAYVETSSHEELVIQADYLIAADGTRSPIRDALGIQRRGRGHIRTIRSVLFHAPALDPYLETGAKQFSVAQSDFKAFMTSYGDSRWVLMFEDDRSRTPEELKAAIVRSVGRDDVDFHIITTGRWQLGALIAETYQRDRIFLAGDAAHQLPPNRGGYGANTGIADAYNLAWKLSAVVQGRAKDGKRLLATYDRERRPIAWLRMQQLFARPDYRADAQGWADGVEIIDDDAIEFGQKYQTNDESALQHEAAAEARHPDEWKAAAGTRLPHAWVRVAGETDAVSTLQLGRQEHEHAWKLLISEDVQVPEQILRSDIPIASIVIGQDVIDAGPVSLKSALALSDEDQVVLVRPDDIVAWRGPASGVRDALSSVLCR